MRKVVIVGAGGLGREALWLLRERIGAGEKIEIAGFIDDAPSKLGKNIAGLKVLGNTKWLLRKLDEFEIILAVGEVKAKRSLAERFTEKGAHFMTLIHPGAIFAPDTSIGEGSIVFPQVVMSADVRIGKFVLLNPGITLSHNVEIGDYCLIGSGAHFAGAVRVGKGCEIGTGANVIPLVKIGSDTIVGAGAAVVEDLPEKVVAVGVPARVIKRRRI